MKIKILTIAIGLLFPIIAIGQISVDYSFNKGVVEIEITNNTTDMLTIVNEMAQYDGGSAIGIKFLDAKGNAVYSNRWSFGSKTSVWIASKKSEKISCALKSLNVSPDSVKKILFDVSIRYIEHASTEKIKSKYFEEKKEIIVE
jgi:hypothetical protein